MGRPPFRIKTGAFKRRFFDSDERIRRRQHQSQQEKDQKSGGEQITPPFLISRQVFFGKADQGKNGQDDNKSKEKPFARRTKSLQGIKQAALRIKGFENNDQRKIVDGKAVEQHKKSEQQQRRSKTGTPESQPDRNGGTAGPQCRRQQQSLQSDGGQGEYNRIMGKFNQHGRPSRETVSQSG